MEKLDLIKAMIYHNKRIEGNQAARARIVAEYEAQENDHRERRRRIGEALKEHYAEELGDHSAMLRTEYLWIDGELHQVELRIHNHGYTVEIVKDTIIPAEVLNEPAQ